MLLLHLPYFCGSLFLITFVVWMSSMYAYRVNARRAADDPNKRNYHPAAIWFSLLWPLYLVIAIGSFIVTSLSYGLFLIVFAILLIAIRKPFLIEWVKRIMNKIGDKALESGSRIIRLFTKDWLYNT